eukprot:gb/GECH01011898.1/.p1 GENE.gb/GECH01011898.1/~~gb/GECH01011898.1/.p1  ORF type:complete len:698 (+),score=179.89 gb/GECH01011898.1/:1-2094(+)
MSQLSQFLILVVTLASLNLLGLAEELPDTKSLRKHLAGPPGEFGFHNLPHPREGGTLADSALIPVRFNTDNLLHNKPLTWETSLPVDTTKRFFLSVFSPIENELSIHLKPPSNSEFKHVINWVSSTRGDVIQEDSFGFGKDIPSTTYDIHNPEEGEWTIRVTGSAKAISSLKTKTAAYLMFFTQSPETVMAFVQDYKKLTSGNQVVMESFMFDTYQVDPEHASKPHVPVESISFKKENVKKAVLDIVSPDGTEESIEMKDDGLEFDTAQNDGLFTAHFTGHQPGVYRASVKMHGTRDNGIEFIRSAQHLVRVVDDHIEFNGKSWTESSSASESIIHLGVNVENQPAAKRSYRAFAQVWGTHTGNNSMVPVAWIGGMTDITDSKGEYSAPLFLNHGWLKRAGVTFPLELRNVWLQETTGFIPVAESQSIRVDSSSDVREAVAATLTPNTITSEMRQGPRPDYLDRVKAQANQDEPGKLMLVHGYCSSAPGPYSYGDFTDYIKFHSWDSNDLVDEFAQKILETGKDLPSFGIFAHSQGGQASLHLHANYWSPLENAQPPNSGEPTRFIQSIGTPYQGCSLAGSIADIGDIFGVGCGENYDLTHDGSALWLSGIPNAARQDVFYYTTQYADSGLVHYCNLAANLGLAWPNDGTVEYKYAQLEGANSMGHKEGYCHTADMHWPPQCRDSERNNIVNEKAAR